jgi:hypothetical protein
MLTLRILHPKIEIYDYAMNTRKRGTDVNEKIQADSMLARYTKTSNDDNNLVNVPIGGLSYIPPYWPTNWPPEAADVMQQWHHVCTANNWLPFGNPRDSPAVGLGWMESWQRQPDIGLEKTNGAYLWQQFLPWLMQCAVLRAVIVLRSLSSCLSVLTVTPSHGRQYRNACVSRLWCRKCVDSTYWCQLFATIWSLTLKKISFSFCWLTYSSHSCCF